MKPNFFFSFITLVFIFLNIPVLKGQEYFLRGHVKDENGLPLPGAGVTVVNTLLGAYCGRDGEYSISIPEKGVYRIRYSFTGYETLIKEVNIPAISGTEIVLKQNVFMTEEVFVSATRAGSTTPVAYSNISGEEIRNLNSGQDLPYLLTLVPSLVETSEAGTGIGYTGMRIRGTDGSRINVTIDGIPLNDAESQQVFWVDIPDLAASVDNIQVQRGVGTSSNGAGAFGASINIKTRTPEEKPSVEVHSSAGSFNTFRNMVMAATGLLADRFAMRIRYSDIRSNGYIKRTGTENRSAMINGIYKTGQSLLKANIILGEEHTGISWWGVPSEMLSTDRRYNPAGEFKDEDGNLQYYENESDNYRQNHYQLFYNLNLNRSLFLHTAIHYTKGEGYYEEYREDQPYVEYGLPDLVIDTTTLSSTDMIRRKWMSNDFYGMVWSLSLKKEKIDAVIGGGINNYIGDHYGKIIWMRYAGNTEKDYQWYLNNSRKGEMSIYGKVNYKLSDKLTGFGDLQYRHISYRMAGPDDDLKNISQSHYFNFVNPKAGLFLSLSPRQDAYISFSVAGREPTRSDFKEASGDEDSTPLPETLFDAEAGYNYRSQNASIGINVFGMYYADQLIPTGELSNVGYPIMTNVDKSYRTGVEFTSELKTWSRLDWKFSLTLSRNKIRNFKGFYIDYNTSDWSSQYKHIDLGTVDIAFSPPVTGSGDLSYSVTGYMKVHLITKYVGKQYFDNTMSSSRTLDPYIVNNLRLDFNRDFRKTGSVGLKFMLNNFLNSLYLNNGYGGLWYEDGIEKSWAYYFPQAGVNFLFSIDINF